ncbi:uncharacterized protein LOC135691865 [Rhopilema esculentum]|uniref:uncharacterized protein LOC135691865 n=1 Tax=Rhopilema esculentum TaxID=499914 RepID=UPI0031E1096C|eukprot:gene9539-17285_t
MNLSESKENFIHALGLRKLSDDEIMLRLSESNTKTSQSRNLQKVRKRPLRKPRVTNVVRKHIFHFSPDGKQSKRGKSTRATEPPKSKADTSVMPKSVVFSYPNNASVKASMAQHSSSPAPSPRLSSSQLPSPQHNLILLPTQNKNQQGIPAQPSIVLGQTIFQGPDGKKFILIPSSTTKPASPGVGHAPKAKPFTPGHTPILPLSGNLKIKTSTEATAPQPGYLYLPQGQTVMSSTTATLRTTSVVTSVTNVLPGSQVIVSPSQKPGTKQFAKKQVTSQHSSSQSNIMHLLNMTRTALSETQFPVASVNFGVWPPNSNQTIQLMKIKPNDITQKDASSVSTASLSRPTAITVQSNALTSSMVASSTVNIPMASLALIPKNTTKQVSVDIPKVDRILNSLSIANKARATLVGTNSMFTSPLSVDFKTVQAKVPISSSIKMSINTDTASLGVAASPAGAAKRTNVHLETSSKNISCSPQAKSQVKVSHISRYLGDPTKNVLNPDTNCLVIQGKKRRKKREFKSFNYLQYRRYGGPPFVPCKAPPAPNTPSSGTCCLYEHTLLKMATRGFWGCEMGQLQDVFRSIRSESIDMDTVEDVTKRCYGFVRRKIVAAGEDSKAMYRYMKNYIDEFDSFLDRVYPVAIIAMLIYLPTASDYSLVTWHGIPPTGWSEYRRAVVMREVFEVVYRFGTELDAVPEYQKEFFDSPVKSALLVPRVFDLRQSYSDPTTCVVQKLSQTDKGAATDESRSLSSEAEMCKEDILQRNIKSENLPGSMPQSKITTATKSSTYETSKTKGCDLLEHKSVIVNLTESGLPNNDPESGKSSSAACGSQADDVDTRRQSEAAKVSESVQNQRSVRNDLQGKPSQNGGLSKKDKMLVKPRNNCLHDGNCSCHNSENIIDQSAFTSQSGGTKLPFSDYNNYCELLSRDGVSQRNEGSTSLTFDSNANKIIRLKEERNISPMPKNGAELTHENTEAKNGEEHQRVITAGFAESIVAACENKKAWMRDSIKQRIEARDVPENTGVTLDSDKKLSLNTVVKNSNPVTLPTRCPETGTSLLETGLGQDSVENRQTPYLRSAADPVPQENLDVADANEQIVYSDQENGSYSNDGSLMSRRRTSRRITNSTRFDLLGASDELSLERDLRKAIKLSKLEVSVGSRPTSENEEAPPESLQVEEIKKTEKIPIRNSLKPFNIKHFGIKDGSDNDVPTLKKINRSVAFEALWTQMSVEEPSVILDNKTYSLGEFLEKFPVETHCPPERTVIRASGHEYKARDILGYLRRGSQLVEQVDNEVVIDTTRTVKSDAVILAVRKVPPGKISKLVHPDLHLENYTGFLLPIGVKQPGKGRRGTGRSAARLKRKSSLTKEEGVIKSEPESPSICSSPFQEIEDSLASPPPQKLSRLRSTDEQFIGEKRDAETETFVAKENKEMQTDVVDQNYSTSWAPSITNITDVDSLEKALNSVLESAMGAILRSDSAANVSGTSEDPFQSLIASYEKAGNFLINTAKSLSRLRAKGLRDPLNENL